MNSREQERWKIQPIVTDEWMPLFLERLKGGQCIKLSPIGMSMYPCLVEARDSVILQEPRAAIKRGDICLYRRENGLYVLHRVHHVNDSGVYMLGDHETWIEGPLRQSQILAVAKSIIRKGQLYDCSNCRRYQIYWRLWLGLRVLRPYILEGWSTVHSKKFTRRKIRE